MTTTTETDLDSKRQAHLWAILLERLQDIEDSDGQLAALRALARLDNDELPIATITETVLTPTDDGDGTLYFDDSDDLWTEGLDLLLRAPARLPLDQVIEALVDVFEQDGSIDQLLGFIEAFSGEIATQPFADLLTKDESYQRQAGLEALYRLDVVVPMLPLLNDPDPDTRALAVENVWLLKGISLEHLAQIAADPAQPQEAREMATSYLGQPAGQEG